MNSSRNSDICLSNACQKKKTPNANALGFSTESKRSLSRYTHNPAYEYWNVLTCLLRYLKGTMNLILDNDETNSTNGYVITLGGGAISWKSSKQTCNARSTMESEFVALEKVGTEAEWLRNLLADIPKWDKPLP